MGTGPDRSRDARSTAPPRPEPAAGCRARWSSSTNAGATGPPSSEAGSATARSAGARPAARPTCWRAVGESPCPIVVIDLAARPLEVLDRLARVAVAAPRCPDPRAGDPAEAARRLRRAGPRVRRHLRLVRLRPAAGGRRPDRPLAPLARRREAEAGPAASPGDRARRPCSTRCALTRPLIPAAPPILPERTADARPPLTEQDVLAALKGVKDPDLQRDLVDLGMIKDIRSSPTGPLELTVNLTTPACPLKAKIEADVREALGRNLGNDREVPRRT